MKAFYDLTFCSTLIMIFEKCTPKYENIVADKISALNRHYIWM